jgi:hypothetical protein
MAGIDNTLFDRILEIIRGDDVAEVPVGTRFARVDAADFALVAEYKWNYNGRYAFAYGADGVVLMHKLILPSHSARLFVDHVDGDGLNNQRHNLRLASHAENMRNRKATGGKSRFKGVWLSKGAWRAEIQLNGKKIRLGTFTKEADAARAYDRAAVEYHGDFARTNADLGLYR